MRIRFLLLVLLTGLSLATLPSTSRAADPLSTLELDPSGTTVSGLSSGAYMAVQLHVAYSESIAGAGIVAGGPYFCAEEQLTTALNRCMNTFLGAPDAGALVERARSLAETGRLDPLSGLAGDRIYLFSGTQDGTVTRPVMDAARAFYRQAGVAEPAIKYVTDVAAGHAFIVEQASSTCGITASPFINDCNYDQAGDILQQLYGPLDPPGSMNENRLFAFDQSEFLANPESHGMSSEGFVYIPAACADGEACRLHISFAGCKQTPADIGDLYARTTGFNRWAETNRLVVLYPQSSVSSGNPNGCWDWWGYDDPAYHTRQGRQMATVAAMAARLGTPFAGDGSGGDGDIPGTAFCRKFDDWNWSHLLNSRVTFCGWFSVCAVGSGEFVGLYTAASTLFENPEGSFSTRPCSP